MLRPTWAEVDLGAIRANTTVLVEHIAPAALMAVVKADGYGHGAATVARAVLDAGATSLAVALVEEGLALRDAGIDAPILVLSEVPADGCEAAIDAELDLTVTTRDGIANIVRLSSARQPRLHLKIDTGMHRVGCAPSDAVGLALELVSNGLELVGVWSHLATADDPKSSSTEHQITLFSETLEQLRAAGIEWDSTHIANSAGGLAHSASRFDIVRCGITLYGAAPSRDLEGLVALQPAMSLHSRISAVRDIDAGEAVSYGGRWTATSKTRIATVPIGYADGVPRRLGLVGGRVLVGGSMCNIRGVVTMDQLMIEVPDDVALGDEVVLLGSQGSESITAWDWADKLDTIAYEVLCGIGPRVPRRYS